MKCLDQIGFGEVPGSGFRFGEMPGSEGSTGSWVLSYTVPDQLHVASQPELLMLKLNGSVMQRPLPCRCPYALWSKITSRRKALAG